MRRIWNRPTATWRRCTCRPSTRSSRSRRGSRVRRSCPAGTLRRWTTSCARCRSTRGVGQQRALQGAWPCNCGRTRIGRTTWSLGEGPPPRRREAVGLARPPAAKRRPRCARANLGTFWSSHAQRLNGCIDLRHFRRRAIGAIHYMDNRL